MEEKGEVLYEIKPKFDFIYELFMPSGKRIKSGLLACFITLITLIILLFGKKYILSLRLEQAKLIYNIFFIIIVILFILSILSLIAKIIFQNLEYKGMSYKFYKDCLIYENNFLNQTKKTIEYSNIREIEIKRNIIDRILNYGIIIIYTNAEKMHSSATVIYAIKNIEEHYNKIESIIHNKNIISEK